VATNKQKQELVDILKFTPQTVTLSVSGYGGECYMGRVDRKIYDYFKEHKIDMEEYANDWDDKFGFVPDEMRPFTPGSPYDCDGFCHASGPEMSDMNTVEVTDENGNTIWEGNLGLDWLDDEQIPVDEWETAIIDDEPEGTVIFWGGQGEKGLLYGGTFELKQPFDPKKLKFNFSNADGWYICNNISYDSEDISNDDLSTTGKWGENKWIIVGGEEVYEGVSRDDIEEESDQVSEDWDPAAELDKIVEEQLMTEWYPADVKPVHKGEYEVDLGKLVAWPFARIVRAEWTGRSWKDSEGKSVKGIEAWRGLAEDPDKLVIFECECVQCDWSGPIDDTHDEDGEMRCPECGEPVELK
jgi:hypothetical protein